MLGAVWYAATRRPTRVGRPALIALATPVYLGAGVVAFVGLILLSLGLSRATQTAMLADMGEWGAMNGVYTGYFSRHLAARSAFGANGLALGARIELECWATVGP